ncbi:dTDP-glucose 4,6-dehydratase [Candidatus Uhrbacteria bacterium]|nr:dTDP-glucose 4,6-dehydratase [Candidatus Uhrbacteria bacterium]
MRILVTGGAGFMGSNFIRHMLARHADLQLVNFDKLTYAGNLENLRDVEDDSRYVFVRGDLADEAAVEALFGAHAFDAVVNYAAETHVDRSILDPKAFLFTDVIGTYHLLEAVKKHGVGRMVQVSTDEVFGSVEDGTFNEMSPFEPNSPYSASKAGGDHLCRAYAHTYGTPVIVTHSCNFYGPYQYPEKVIPLFITNLLEGKNVPVYGDGQQVREWIFTEDHCRAIEAVLEKGIPGEVYNIGTEERRPNLELTRLLLGLCGRDASFIEHVKDRPGHDRRYAVDASKIRRELGWAPEVSLEDGLAKTVEWYKTHEAWWKPLKSGAYLEYYKKQYVMR